MFLTHTKHALVEAVKRTFDAAYPEGDFQSLNVGIDLPLRSVDYPAIWVDFEPTQQLRRAGVAHVEEATAESGDVGQFTRWTFAGYATFTAIAMTALERDRLADQLIRVLAFGDQLSETRRFRDWIQENPFIGLQFDFDEIGMRGFTARAGTPWGTGDYMYEGTAQMECIGDFVADQVTYDLIPLERVDVYEYTEAEGDPLVGTEGWH